MYKRHSNFAVEPIEQTFNGQVGFNRKVTAQISRNGDMLTHLWLEITMTYDPSLNEIPWYPAEALVSEAELEIGGQKIDKHNSDWFRINDELFHDEAQKKAYKRMTNFTTEEIAATGLVTRRMYLPLQFFFCVDPACALPLVSLAFHEVKINFTFAAASQVLGIKSAEFNAQLYADYVFLDQEERTALASMPQDMLIKQLQMAGHESVGDLTTTFKKTSNIRLTYNHPCLFLAWVIRGTRHGWYNTSRAYDTSPAGTSPDSAYNDAYAPVQSVKLQINGQDRATERRGSYHSQVVPYETSGSCPQAGIYMLSFSQNPKSHTQPSGSLNFSRVDNANLQLTFKPSAASTATNAGKVTDADTSVYDVEGIALNTFRGYAQNWNVFKFEGGILSANPSTSDCRKKHLCPTAGRYVILEIRGKRCHRLVECKNSARRPGCGKPLRAVTTIQLGKPNMDIRGNDLGFGNNVTDWAIRRAESKPVVIGHDSLSEIAKASVIDDELITPRLLKVRSNLSWKHDGKPLGVASLSTQV